MNHRVNVKVHLLVTKLEKALWKEKIYLADLSSVYTEWSTPTEKQAKGKKKKKKKRKIRLHCLRLPYLLVHYSKNDF